jgi:RND family efflux transporter MFP subunit
MNLLRPSCRSTASLALASVALAASAADIPLATLTVAYEQAPRERIYDGTVEAVNQATVSAQTSGRVAEIFYDVDDFVEAGAPIMRFTDTEQRAALDSARGALAEAEARAAEAESEFTRVETMFENGTVARSRFEQAQANRDAAVARLEAARAGFVNAEQQLEYTLVRAPYAGIVSQRHVEVGELVRPGAPLMSGLSLEHVRVVVDVPQSMLEPIREIGAANVYAADRTIAAESLTFFPVADPATNTFRVRAVLPAGSVTLYPGTFVKVGFVVGQTERLLVPESSVVRRSELTAVYVIDSDAVTLRQIRTGRRYGERIEVLAGLAPGEAVAADPVAAGVYLQEQR